MKKTTKIIIGLLAAITLLIVVISIIPESEEKASKQNDYTTIDASEAAVAVGQAYIKSKATVPESVYFPYESVKIARVDSSAYLVSGLFTAKNKFNVKLKKQYSVRLRYNQQGPPRQGKNWNVEWWNVE